MRTTASRRRRAFGAGGLALALALTGGLLTVSPIPASHAAAGTAFVRVNQVGYPSPSSKRAYLLSSAAETGATFSVEAGSSIVFSGPIGANLGSWSTAYPDVYALDFSSVTVAGSYSISVSGPVPAT